MNRRDFLRNSAGYASLNTIARTFGLAYAACPLLPQNAQAQSPHPVIDMHCHVFNGHDLPIKGFINKTFLREIYEKKSFFKLADKKIQKFVNIANEWMLTNAYSAEQETIFLTNLRNGTANLPTADEIRKRDLKLLIKLFSDLRNNGGKHGLGLAASRKMKIAMFPGRFTHENRKGYKIDAVKPPEMARRVLETGKKENELTKFFKWALLLTRYRFQIIQELSGFHKKQVQLLTPAMIDFDLWLNKKAGDDAKSSIPKQVEVYTQISRHYIPGDETFGTPVHGFVGFDPLREAFYRKGGEARKRAVFHNDDKKLSPIDHVKTAILEHGCVGVKLYPPMGFRPLNNAELKRQDFPEHVRKTYSDSKKLNGLNKEIDNALDVLYSWCEENNVPILAHARDSNGSGKGYSKRADPNNWDEVTEKYDRLKICLGHMGGFKEIFDAKNPSYEDTWEWHFAKLVEKAGNSPVYGDISFMLAPYKSSKNRRYIKSQYVHIFKNFPQFKKRLIFGSDWIMLARVFGVPNGSGNATYLNDVRKFMSEAGLDSELDNIFSQNAIAFLGLDDGRENANRTRLLKFYDKHKLDDNWLTAISVNYEI